MSQNAAKIEQLAIDQLSAYNAHDIDSFCACYHPEVRVISVYGEDVISGIEDFRARYAPMFARGRFGGEVTERMVAGPHCVERELWWREDAVSGERLSGEVLVRYTLRDQTIGAVVFMRAEDPASVAS